MTDRDLVAGAIEQATREVFETMLGSDASPCRGPEGAEPEAGVVSLVGLTGAWSGSGTISCTPAGAKLVAERMLMLDPQEDTSINDDVLDAVAELTNMIIGNIKNLLADSLGEMAISIPTVVYGRNFKFKNLAGMMETTTIFDWEGHRVDVKVCLTQTAEESGTVRARPEPAVLALD